jgi:hypothetical protein
VRLLPELTQTGLAAGQAAGCRREGRHPSGRTTAECFEGLGFDSATDVVSACVTEARAAGVNAGIGSRPDPARRAPREVRRHLTGALTPDLSLYNAQVHGRGAPPHPTNEGAAT